ncbi:MAG: 50S ribosomal protein L29 [Candidatus Paceibacterota bacterium]|jgi:large subunit ribosomal protein L29
MKISELKTKPKEELYKLLLDSSKKLQELKFNLAAGKVKNVRSVRALKKDIARILTLLNEMKEIL